MYLSRRHLHPFGALILELQLTMAQCQPKQPETGNQTDCEGIEERIAKVSGDTLV